MNAIARRKKSSGKAYLPVAGFGLFVIAGGAFGLKKSNNDTDKGTAFALLLAGMVITGLASYAAYRRFADEKKENNR